MVKNVKHTSRWRREVMWRDPVARDNFGFFVLLVLIAIIPWLTLIPFLWKR